jgi:hypothetical protein
MRLDIDKAGLCLSLLTEGSSIRSTERVSGVHRGTLEALPTANTGLGHDLREGKTGPLGGAAPISRIHSGVGLRILTSAWAPCS